MTKFIDYYRQTVTSKFKEWKTPDVNNEIFKALYGLGDAVDSIIPEGIHKQELAGPTGELFEIEALGKEDLGNTRWYGPSLIKDIRSILDKEILSIWSQPWMIMKSAARSAAASGSPPPPLVMSGVVSSFNSSFTKLIASKYGGVSDVSAISMSIEKLLNEAYSTYNKTQANPYNPA